MSTTRIPRAQVDGLSGRVVTVMTRGMFGTTPDSIGVLSRSGTRSTATWRPTPLSA